MDVKKPVDREDLLSASDAAAMLPDTSAQTVMRWAKEGLIPFVEMPGGKRRRKYFRRSDIEDLLEPRVLSAPSAGSPANPPAEAPAPLPGQEMLSWPSSSRTGAGGA